MAISNRRKWGGLAILSLALAIIVIDTTIINVSLRTIVGDLHTNIQTLQWVITGYALMVAAFTVTGGRLGDLFGRKRMFLLGALLFAAGSLTAALAHSATQLILGAAIVQGFGAALMMPATTSILLSTFAGRERAIAFGVWGGVAGAAASVGPLLGGYLTTNFSWRYAYGINLVIVAIVMLFSWLIVDSREKIARPTVDFIGILLSSLGLASIVFGIVESSTYGWIKAKEQASFFGQTLNLGDYSIVLFALILGAFLLVMFGMWQVIVESRGKTPLVSPKLVSNTRFTAGVSTMGILTMGQFGMFFTLPVFLQSVRGLDAFHTGLALIPFSLSVLIAAPLSAAVLSRLIGLKRVIILGVIICVIGILYLRELITPDATARDLIPALIINGVGFGMAIANLANITLSAVNVAQAGEASGINNTFRQLGATLGTALLGAVLISTLQTGITNGIQQSRVVPGPLKSKIEQGVHAQVQSLGQDSGGSSTARLPQPVVQELGKIRAQATADGLRDALAYGAGILTFGVLLSLRLPKQTGPAHITEPITKPPVTPTTADSVEPLPETDAPPPEAEPAQPEPPTPVRKPRTPIVEPAKKPIHL